MGLLVTRGFQLRGSFDTVDVTYLVRLTPYRTWRGTAKLGSSPPSGRVAATTTSMDVGQFQSPQDGCVSALLFGGAWDWWAEDRETDLIDVADRRLTL